MNNYQVINLEYLFEIAGNDKSLIKELIDVFILQIEEFKTDIETALENKDIEMLKHVAHKFKSSVRMFGMNEVGEKLNTIETYTNLEQDVELKSIIEFCIEQCELAKDELNVFFNSSSTTDND